MRCHKRVIMVQLWCCVMVLLGNNNVHMMYPCEAMSPLSSWTGNLSSSTARAAIHNNPMLHQTSSKLFRDLLENFQGDFDNFNQVVSDRSNGLTPGVGGGHEHIHCTLIPQNLFVSHNNRKSETIPLDHHHGGDWVLAAYYFDGLPERIFRFRLYELLDGARVDDNIFSSESNEDLVIMKLYTLLPSIEGRLRSIGSDPLKWWDIINGSVGGTLDVHSQSEACKLLQGCEVVWKSNPDPMRHIYLEHGLPNNAPNNTKYLATSSSVAHAFMVKDSVEIDSQMAPGTKILVKDELSLWRQELLINDRGYDLDGNYIYGNQRGVPYRMNRVACIKSGKSTKSEDSPQVNRMVVEDDLAWTLGPNWRTEDVYQSKLLMVGGVTTKMNSK